MLVQDERSDGAFFLFQLDVLDLDVFAKATVTDTPLVEASDGSFPTSRPRVGTFHREEKNLCFKVSSMLRDYVTQET